jgi:Arabinose-binding domain of AraC transcription regulator, N-term
MGRRYSTRATKLAGLVEIAAERGADIDVLIREAGLNQAVLRSPETAIDYGGFCELLWRCAVAWNLPDIGLRMIRYQQIDFLGPVALVTRMERTVRGALQAIIANLVVHANATVAAFEEDADGDTASLILNQRDDAPKERESCHWSPAPACRCRRCPRHSAIPSRACSTRHSGAGTAERRIDS